MYQAINERTEERTGMFWSESELEEHLKRVSTPDDFWDVMKDGRLSYYWQMR